MSYKNFYKYIVEVDGHYRIVREGKDYGRYSTLADALYERDRLIAVDWNWDLAMDLPETINGYLHINLPPFNHQPTHISVDKECWVVREKGRKGKYHGRYLTEEEAKKVALMYNANVSHKNKAYRVQKRIDGKTRYFGRYSTYEKAKRRVKELDKNGWRTGKDTK